MIPKLSLEVSAQFIYEKKLWAMPAINKQLDHTYSF